MGQLNRCKYASQVMSGVCLLEERHVLSKLRNDNVGELYVL